MRILKSKSWRCGHCGFTTFVKPVVEKVAGASEVFWKPRIPEPPEPSPVQNIPKMFLATSSPKFPNESPSLSGHPGESHCLILSCARKVRCAKRLNRIALALSHSCTCAAPWMLTRRVHARAKRVSRAICRELASCDPGSARVG